MSTSGDRPPAPLSLFTPPYSSFERLPGTEVPSPEKEPVPGAALVWELGKGDWGGAFRSIRSRPPGVALIMILPPAEELDEVGRLLEAAEQCRPHSVLPYHDRPEPEEIAAVLRRPPEDLSTEVMDFLWWRGIQVDLDTRRLVRRTVELSAELRTVSALARGLYLSRRALGRRFQTRGLPVPSHCLHFFRVLRAALELQNSDGNLFEVGCRFGYPDGFSLSNQMKRLTGLRPSTARKCLGWEWIVESWLRVEAEEGKIDLPLSGRPAPRPGEEAPHLRGEDPGEGSPSWRGPESVRSTRS